MGKLMSYKVILRSSLIVESDIKAKNEWMAGKKALEMYEKNKADKVPMQVESVERLKDDE